MHSKYITKEVLAKGKHQLEQQTSERQGGLSVILHDALKVHHKIGTRQRQAPVTAMHK
jgi:hypothetical protein